MSEDREKMKNIQNPFLKYLNIYDAVMKGHMVTLFTREIQDKYVVQQVLRKDNGDWLIELREREH